MKIQNALKTWKAQKALCVFVALSCLAAGAAIVSGALTQAARSVPSGAIVDRGTLPTTAEGWASSGPLLPLPGRKPGARHYAQTAERNAQPADHDARPADQDVDPGPSSRLRGWLSWTVGLMTSAP